MTNREWLNSLSDNDLAKVLHNKTTFNCMFCAYEKSHKPKKKVPCTYSCNDGMTKWLDMEFDKNKSIEYYIATDELVNNLWNKK